MWALLNHEIKDDWEAIAIGEVYHFLFGSALNSPPATPSVFIYCHPSRILTFPVDISDVEIDQYEPEMLDPEFDGNENLRKVGKDEDAISSLEFNGGENLIDEISEGSPEEENVPNWISSSERFIEQNNYYLRKMAQDKSASNLKKCRLLRIRSKKLRTL